MRWDFGAVQFSEWDADGFLGVQIDPAEADDEKGAASLCELHGPYGFISRPSDPDRDGLGCSVLRMQRGSQERYAWLGSDPRQVDWLPRLTKGGSAQYGGTTGRALTWREIDGETGSVIDYVPEEWDADGNATAAHKIEAGVDGNGAPVVQIIHSEGMAVVMFDGAVTMADATGSGFITIKDGKIAASGALKATSGLDVGGTGGVEVPLHPALAAAVNAFAAAVSAAPTGYADGGLALKAALVTAANALAAAVSAGKSTMLKTL